MIIHKAFKFRLKTNPETESQLAQFAGCCRFVWNKALCWNMNRLKNKLPMLWYQELAFWLTFWKSTEELSFLKDAPSQALQQTLKSLEKTFKDAFDKSKPTKRLPRFKKKGRHDSFRLPQGFRIKGNRIFLPKIGWMKFFKSREILGVPRNVTISRHGQHWFFSIQVEQQVDAPVHPANSDVGIDMGVVRFATLSDRTVIEPINSFRNLEKRLATAQRRLAKKKKFSNTWKKQKTKVAKLHIKIANARMDYLHKQSTQISKNHAVIYLEDLKVRNMSGSAKGTMEDPGKNVKAKSGLNKSILDQGWYEFRRQLGYKQNWLGGWVLTVNPKNTSISCSDCGNINKENRKTQAQFCCTVCGYKENADFVAATNILAAGRAALACGEKGLPISVKQEPAGTSNQVPILTAPAA